MWVGFRCRYINHHGDHWLFERNMADAQSWNGRLDVLLEHLLKPDFGIDTSVYAVVEAGWLVVMLGHAVNDLAAVCISKGTDISCHFELLIVVPLIDSWGRLVFQRQALFDVGYFQCLKLGLLF